MKKYIQAFSHAGFDMFPLIPGGKEPACRWTTEATSDIEEMRSLFSGVGSTGYGIATGRRSGIFVVDVDVKDGAGGVDSWDDLCRENDYSPDTLTIKTASGGFHYYYSYPVDIAGHIPNSAGSLAAGVDIRGDGGFVVGPGSVTEKGEYDVICGDAAEEAPIWLIQRVEKSESAAVDGGVCYTANEKLDIVDALQHVDASNYDVWVKAGMICKDAGLFDEWDTWSATARNYGGADVCAKHWNSFNSGGVTADTLYFWARENGWRGRVEIPEPQEEAQVSKLGETISFSQVINAIPGGVKELYDYFLSIQAKHQPGFALISALAVFSVCSARRYVSSERNTTDMFFVVLGESGCGKESAITTVKNAVDDAGLGRVYCGGYQSAGAVLSELLYQPAHIALIDELGRHLSTAGSNVNKTEALTTLMELFSKGVSSYTPMSYSLVSEFRKKETKGEDTAGLSPDMFTVYNPGVSMLGATTTSAFYDALSSGSLTDGFVSRLLVYRSKEGRQKRIPGKWRPMSQHLADTLLYIRRGEPRHKPAFDDYKQRPSMVPVSVSTEAQNVFSKLEDHVIRLQDKAGEKLANVLNRTVEKAMRIATIAAIADEHDKPVITEAHARWSCMLALHCDESLLVDVSENVADNNTERDKNGLLSIIRSSGDSGISKASLIRNSKWLTRNSRIDYLNELIECSSIQEIKEGKKTLYKAN
jgi:hypothetical protein